MSGLLCGLFDGGVATENDQVGERNLPGAGLVEVLLDGFETRQDFGQFSGIVDFPGLLRGEANAGSIGTSTHVRGAERGG